MLFTSSFAGLVPNVGLGPYCVAKYGVVALAEVLASRAQGGWHRRLGPVPDVVATNIGTSERNRSSDYGRRTGPLPVTPAHAPPPATAGGPPPGPGRAADVVLDVDDVARLTVEAILADRLYVLPHQGARGSIRRRFERIDSTFEEQAAAAGRLRPSRDGAPRPHSHGRRVPVFVTICGSRDSSRSGSHPRSS